MFVITVCECSSVFCQACYMVGPVNVQSNNGINKLRLCGDFISIVKVFNRKEGFFFSNKIKLIFLSTELFRLMMLIN